MKKATGNPFYTERKRNFELFKSNVCHELKRPGDTDFLIKTLQEDKIMDSYEIYLPRMINLILPQLLESQGCKSDLKGVFPKKGVQNERRESSRLFFCRWPTERLHRLFDYVK